MIERLGGLSSAMVASAPTFISNSPSPVTTRIRRSRRASARPSPIMQAPPIAPPMAKPLAAFSVNAAMSRAVPASPAMIKKSSCRPMSAGSASRRSSAKTGAPEPELSFADDDMASSKAFGAKQLLGEQHRDRLPRLEHHGQCGAYRSQGLLRRVGAQAVYTNGLQHRRDRLSHGVLPWIALAEVAPHGDERQERKSSRVDERQHVDAVADPAALHE